MISSAMYSKQPFICKDSFTMFAFERCVLIVNPLKYIIIGDFSRFISKAAA